MRSKKSCSRSDPAEGPRRVSATPPARAARPTSSGRRLDDVAAVRARPGRERCGRECGAEREVVLGIDERAAAGEQLRGRAFGDDAAEVDDHDAVGERLHLAQKVGRQEHGAAAVGKVAQELAHPAHAGWVKPVGGLVEDQDLRVAQQRVRDPQPLAHAQRVVAEALARCRAVEADAVEQAVDAARVDAHQLRGDGQRLTAAPAAVLGGRVEEDADPPAGVGEVAVGGTENERLARVGLGEAREHS